MKVDLQPVVGVPTAPQDSGRESPRDERVKIIIAGAVPAVLYLIFVVHFGRNGIYWDDWSFVPLVNGVLHHHLSFGQLWQQHNDNRMAIPYFLVAAIGFGTHLDTKTILYVSAGMFLLSFIVILGTYRHYAGRTITPVQALLLGLVWFSIVDTENALWAFQIAWYLVLLCLTAMLFVLSRPKLTMVLVAVAVIITFIASYSSLQGLILWPVGLMAVVWQVRDRRQLALVASSWLASAAVALFLYFRGFDFSPATTGGGSLGYAWHHPIQTIGFVLAMIGNILPTSTLHTGLHQVVGAVVLVAATLVLVGAVRSWQKSSSLPLPVLLIVFALLFDLSIAAGRVSFGVARAFSPRYTMANLLIVVALAMAVFAVDRARPVHRRRYWILPSVSLAELGLTCLIVAQVAVSTVVGLQSAAAWTHRIEEGDTIVVHLDRISQPDRTLLFDGYVFPSYVGATELGWVEMVQRDGLGELAPGAARTYVNMAPPVP